MKLSIACLLCLLCSCLMGCEIPVQGPMRRGAMIDDKGECWRVYFRAQTFKDAPAGISVFEATVMPCEEMK